MANEDKHLPIRLFQKREIDTRETEGGGGKDPKWVLSDQKLSAHALQVSEQFSQSFSSYLIDEDLDFDIPLPVGVELKEKATAKSHRDSVEKVFVDEKNKIASIGFSPRDELLFALNTSKHIKKVSNKLEKPEANKKGISAIAKLNKYKPVVEDGLDLKGKLKIKLIPYDNPLARKVLQNSFIEFCKKRKVKVKKCNYSSNVEIYKASKVTQDSLGDISDFNGVLSIESMPAYEFANEYVVYRKDINLKAPDSDKDYPKVGVLDSGISLIDPISPWIIGEQSPYDEGELNKAHGTFVAGIIVYGDELLNKKSVGCEECQLFDGAVISDKNLGKIDEDELLDNIREVVSDYKNEIKLWSLSLGSKKEANTRSFSDFGMELDGIQDTHNVLIIKSAGNCFNFEKGKPPSRISESADSVRSVVVGSIAHVQSQTDIAKLNHISPFSRIGPGPQHIIKPDLVQYGGNSGLSAEGKRLDSGVLSFSTDGKIIGDCGTSFSTPRISALIASVNHNIVGNFNPLLLKTLAIHSARYPVGINDPVKEKLKQYGFGLPPSIDRILLNSPNEITLILEDELPKGQFIEILDFPFPNNLVDSNGYYDAEIIVTLVNHSVLDETQGKEYCQSDLEIFFGTYDGTEVRDIKKPNIKNPLKKINTKNVLNKSLYSKRPQKRIGIVYEPTLIQNGKYHPVKKFHCDLSHMTKGNKIKCLLSNKKWFLKLTGFYRSKTERIADDYRMDLSQKFCIAITIKDPSGDHEVYNQVSQFLDQRQFVHERIQLRQEVRVR
jgi:Subtilase family